MKKENTIQLVGGFVLACIVVGVFVTEEQVLRRKQSLADEVLDHKIDVKSLKRRVRESFPSCRGEAPLAGNRSVLL